MKRQRGTSRRSLPRATVIPNPGFQELHGLLRKVHCLDDPEPTVRAIGLQLTWADAALRDGPLTVSIDRDTAAEQGCISADGSFVKTQRCSPETVIALRNLAADPGRRFRRYGQDTARCPFCQRHLGFGELSSILGYCAECASRLEWPFNDRAAERAEEILRQDVMREIEAEDIEPEDRLE